MAAWAPGGGATAVLRAACAAVTARGERAAWIDGAGTACADAWRGEAALLRPTGEREALECAEELVRSGGFALVVLAGARTADVERVRLSCAVREGGGALAVLEEGGFMAGVRVASRIRPGRVPLAPRPVRRAGRRGVGGGARARGGSGWSREAEFSLSVESHDLRLSRSSALRTAGAPALTELAAPLLEAAPRVAVEAAIR